MNVSVCLLVLIHLLHLCVRYVSFYAFQIHLFILTDLEQCTDNRVNEIQTFVRTSMRIHLRL